MKEIQNLGKIDVLILAEYILKNYGPMSHLKLQKLLFYCQAYHLAYFGEAIIDDDFQAWVHGPVCRKVYDSLKNKSVLYSDVKYTNENGCNPDLVIEKSLASMQTELLNDILKELSTWTGLELESSTHRESPWINARVGFSSAEICEKIISNELMKEFYSKEING